MKCLTPEEAINTCYYVATDDNGKIYTLWNGLVVHATAENAHMNKIRVEDKMAIIQLDDYLSFGLAGRLQRVG